MRQLSTTARLLTCRRCRTLTIHALDAPTAARHVTLEPIPLSPIEELAELLAGRPTYDLIRTARTPEIVYRCQFRIQAPRRWPVLALHQCPGQIPTTALRTIAAKTKGKGADGEPPF